MNEPWELALESKMEADKVYEVLNKEGGLDDLFAIDFSAKGSSAACGIVSYTIKATSGPDIASIKGTGKDTILNINMDKKIETA